MSAPGDAHEFVEYTGLLLGGHPALVEPNHQYRVVAILVAISGVSLVAVVWLLLELAIAAWDTWTLRARHYFFRTNVAPYFICLLLADVFQAVGSIMNARWISLGTVEAGSYCVGQGVIKHIADISAALWSLVIAIHTFCLLFYQVYPPRWSMYITLVGITGFILMLTVVSRAIFDSTNSVEFYGISGLWCWISPEYAVAQIVMDYVIMFLSALLCLILYVLVFLRLRGNIVVEMPYFRFRRRGAQEREGLISDRALVVAKHMLLYPVIYTILLLPIATARFSEWAGHSVSFQVTVFCDSVFLLSGVCNMLLFVFTSRRNALPSRTFLGRFFPSVLPKRKTSRASFVSPSVFRRYRNPWETTTDEKHGCEERISPMLFSSAQQVAIPGIVRISSSAQIIHISSSFSCSSSSSLPSLPPPPLRQQEPEPDVERRMRRKTPPFLPGLMTHHFGSNDDTRQEFADKELPPEPPFAQCPDSQPTPPLHAHTTSTTRSSPLARQPHLGRDLNLSSGHSFISMASSSPSI